jgi:hypothetical protein
MFEEIEQANDGRELILAPQNHPAEFVSFVWDTTAEGGDAEATPAEPVAVEATSRAE